MHVIVLVDSARSSIYTLECAKGCSPNDAEKRKIPKREGVTSFPAGKKQILWSPCVFSGCRFGETQLLHSISSPSIWCPGSSWTPASCRRWLWDARNQLQEIQWQEIQVKKTIIKLGFISSKPHLWFRVFFQVFLRNIQWCGNQRSGQISQGWHSDIKGNTLLRFVWWKWN